MTSPAIIFLLCVLYLAVVSGQWVNNYDEAARLECGDNQVFSFIGSIHSNRHKDRRWQFQCRPEPSQLTSCYWTDWLNGFDAPLLFNCPGDEILNGMDSYHNNGYEDRRFKVKCCRPSNLSARICYFTNYINDWDGEMNFSVPEGRAIKGLYSVHDNNKEDRRWKINLCTYL